jgi:hypothetical protein
MSKLSSHIWKGGTPNFQANLKLNNIEILVTSIGNNINIKILIKKIIEAKDCVKKYLNLIISGFFTPFESPKIGIKRSILISIILQVINILLRDTPKTQLVINIKINKVLVNQAIILTLTQNQ